jgi:streptomycin 6-kinase
VKSWTAVNSTVKVFEHHVEKWSSAPVETAGKYSAIQEIGARSGFVAPRVLEIKSDRILLERLKSITSLRELYLKGEKRELDVAIKRAGEVLATLHAQLPRDGGRPWVPPARFANDLEKYAGRPIDPSILASAVLHGDYSFANVFVTDGASRDIAIIDPCPNFGSTFDLWTLAPVYIDVGKMLACLEGQVPIRNQLSRPSDGRINELQEIFLSGYARLGNDLDLETACAFAFATVSAQFRRRLGVLGAVHRTALYNRLRGNFPGKLKMAGMRRTRHG